jgi:hypothetical protein
MIVVITAFMPRVTAVPPVVVVIPIPLAGLGHDAAGCDRHERQKETALGDSLFNCHTRS